MPPPTAVPAAPAAPEDPFRASPPATSDDWQPTGDSGHAFTLPNGLRLVVVERHGIPFVNARLGMRVALPPKDPKADLRNALAGDVFLSPRDTGEPLGGWCGSVDCGVGAWGASNKLGDLLRREAALVRTEPERAELERRLALASRGYGMSAGDPFANGRRNAGVLLFGYDHPYAAPADAPNPITLDELRSWRRSAFVPAGATLVVVGDVAFEETKALVTRYFGDWRGQASPRGSVASPPLPPSPLPPLPDGPRALFTPNGYLPTDYATVVARGPAWGDPDVAAVLVALEIYEAPLPRPAPCREIENRRPTSLQRVPLAFFRGVSVATIGGSFAPKTAVAQIRAVLEAIRASRGADVSAPTLARAKRLAIAQWRRRGDDWGALANTVATALDAGALESAFGLEDKIAAVTAADVRRVAERYFAEDAIRVALIGAKDHFRALKDLGVGGAFVVDAYARPTPPGWME
jgi:zinc protease